MGEIADSLINGEVCQVCGCWLEDSMGFPTTCADCEQEDL